MPFSLASMSRIDIKHPSYILKNKNEIAQSAMKSAAQMKSKQAWMKLNPPRPSPREAGFHCEAISSTAGGFIPPKADLVEKSTATAVLFSGKYGRNRY